jgi:hypothetical protein
VVVHRHDAAEVDPGFRQRQLRPSRKPTHGAVVELDQVVAVDPVQQRGVGRGQLRVGEAADGEDQVVGVDGLAVVELQPRLQAQGPAAGIGIGLGELGQGQARLHLLVPFPQLAVQGKATHDAAADGLVGVEVAALVAVDDAQAQAPAMAWLVGHAMVGPSAGPQPASSPPASTPAWPGNCAGCG